MEYCGKRFGNFRVKRKLARGLFPSILGNTLAVFL